MTKVRTGFSEAPAGSTGTSQGKFRTTATQSQRESQFTMVVSASFNSRFPVRVFQIAPEIDSFRCRRDFGCVLWTTHAFWK